MRAKGWGEILGAPGGNPGSHSPPQRSWCSGTLEWAPTTTRAGEGSPNLNVRGGPSDSQHPRRRGAMHSRCVDPGNEIASLKGVSGGRIPLVTAAVQVTRLGPSQHPNWPEEKLWSSWGGSNRPDPNRSGIQGRQRRGQRDCHDRCRNGPKRPCESRGGTDACTLGTSGTSKLPMSTMPPAETAGRCRAHLFGAFPGAHTCTPVHRRRLVGAPSVPNTTPAVAPRGGPRRSVADVSQNSNRVRFRR